MSSKLISLTGIHVFICQLICLCLPLFSFSQKSGNRIEIIESIDSVIHAAIKEYAFPGAVLLIATSDSILYKKGYGYHTYDSIRAVQANHLYDLASVTKVTAATLALMTLYEDSLLFLDDPIKKYISGFLLNKRGKTTIRQTLAHQAGWRSWIPYYQEMLKKDGTYKPRFLSVSESEKYSIRIHDNLYLTNKNYQYIKKQIRRSDFDLSRGYSYSGLFFYMVPELVERSVNLSFTDFLQDRVYDPLGADSLTFNPRSKYPDSLIVPTELDTFFRKVQIHGFVHDEGAILMNGISGNAGLFGTASSVANVWRPLMSDRSVDSMGVFSPQTVDVFTSVQFPNQGNRRGLGFDKPLLVYDSIKSSVSKFASSQSFGHSGYTGPLVWADPKNDLLFVFLTNRVYPSRSQRGIYDLNVRPKLHDLSYRLRAVYQNPYLE
jgi:CubicO group peptidase (beta-lactamase class C family)